MFRFKNEETRVVERGTKEVLFWFCSAMPEIPNDHDTGKHDYKHSGDSYMEPRASIICQISHHYREQKSN
jgi:hypothetical protein